MSITFAIEKVRDVIDELVPLWKSHWEETEMYRAGQGFNPNIKDYIGYNDVGFYILYTMRDNGKLVGNGGMYVTPSMHTQKLIATDDTVYVLPEYRKGYTAIKFLKFLEADLFKRGVVEISITIKSEKVRKLYEIYGYKLIAYHYVKDIEANHVRSKTAATG